MNNPLELWLGWLGWLGPSVWMNEKRGKSAVWILDTPIFLSES